MAKTTARVLRRPANKTQRAKLAADIADTEPDNPVDEKQRGRPAAAIDDAETANPVDAEDQPVERAQSAAVEDDDAQNVPDAAEDEIDEPDEEIDDVAVRETAGEFVFRRRKGKAKAKGDANRKKTKKKKGGRKAKVAVHTKVNDDAADAAGRPAEEDHTKVNDDAADAAGRPAEEEVDSAQPADEEDVNVVDAGQAAEDAPAPTSDALVCNDEDADARQQLVSLPSVDPDSLQMISTNSAPEFNAGTDKVLCQKCRAEVVLDMNDRRKPYKTKEGWFLKCILCNRTCSAMSRRFGSWPIASFQTFDEQEQLQFYEDAKHAKSSDELLNKLIDHASRKNVEFERNTRISEFLPLSVWQKQGWNPEVIEREAQEADIQKVSPDDIRYRVTITKGEEGKVREKTREQILTSVKNVGGKPGGMKAIEDVTDKKKKKRKGSSSSSSNRSSSSSSSSSSHDKKSKKKKKKSKKHKKDKKKKADKSRKEKQQMSDSENIKHDDGFDDFEMGGASPFQEDERSLT